VLFDLRLLFSSRILHLRKKSLDVSVSRGHEFNQNREKTNLTIYNIKMYSTTCLFVKRKIFEYEPSRVHCDFTTSLQKSTR
jgi:hypothetical protein